MRSSAPAVLAAAKIKERGREAISLIFCPMFWPRCQLTMIGFPENSRALGGNVTRGSKYIIISPRPSHNSLTPGGDPKHILKGVWKSVRWQFKSSIKYLCILLMVSDEFYDQETEWISDLDSKQWSGFIFQRSFSKIQQLILWKLRFNWSYLKALADNNWPNMKLSHSCCFKLGNLIPGWQTLTFFSIVSVNTASGSHYWIVHPKTTLMEKLQLNSCSSNKANI